MSRITKRLAENYKATFTYTPELLEQIAQRCTEVESGARNIEQVITHQLLPDLSAEILRLISDGGTLTAVDVGIGPDGEFVYSLH